MNSEPYLQENRKVSKNFLEQLSRNNIRVILASADSFFSNEEDFQQYVSENGEELKKDENGQPLLTKIKARDYFYDFYLFEELLKQIKEYNERKIEENEKIYFTISSEKNKKLLTEVLETAELGDFKYQLSSLINGGIHESSEYGRKTEISQQFKGQIYYCNEDKNPLFKYDSLEQATEKLKFKAFASAQDEILEEIEEIERDRYESAKLLAVEPLRLYKIFDKITKF